MFVDVIYCAAVGVVAGGGFLCLWEKREEEKKVPLSLKNGLFCLIGARVSFREKATVRVLA